MQRKFILFAALSILTACGDSNSPGTVSAPVTQESKISGLVLTDDGPVTKARIEIKDSAGATVAKQELNGNDRYSLTLPAGTAFPLVVYAYPENTPEPLKAAIVNAMVAEQDVSPVSTIVVETAVSLGGINDANLTKAAVAAIHQRKSGGGQGGSSATFKGDPTKQFGGWH